jgi:chemotaxis protein CheD
VHYFPATGKVLLLELQRTEREVLVANENSYKSRIEVEPVAGSVELF